MKTIIAQNWLNQILNKDKIKVIGRDQGGAKNDEFLKLEDDEFLEGKLKIDGFPNLQIIDLKGEICGTKGSLTEVVITNCPKVKSVNLTNNEVSLLDVNGLDNLINVFANQNRLGKIN